MMGLAGFVRRTRRLTTIELERAWRARTTWIVAGAMIAVAGLVTLGATHQGSHAVLATEARAAEATRAALPPPVQELRTAFSGVAALRIFVVLLGVLCVTSEYQHGDIVWRYLAEPSRTVLVAAKAAASALIGALLGVLTLQVGTLLEVGFGAPGATYGLSSREALLAVAGSVLATALAGVLGVGIGAAVRNQTAAVVGTLVAVLLVEPVVSGLIPKAGVYLPSQAAAAAAGHAALGWVAGLSLSAGYAAAAVVLGGWLCAHRDV